MLTDQRIRPAQQNSQKFLIMTYFTVAQEMKDLTDVVGGALIIPLTGEPGLG